MGCQAGAGKNNEMYFGEKRGTRNETSSQCGKSVAEEPLLTFGELDRRHLQALLISLPSLSMFSFPLF